MFHVLHDNKELAVAMYKTCMLALYTIVSTARHCWLEVTQELRICYVEGIPEPSVQEHCETYGSEDRLHAKLSCLQYL